MPKLKKNLDAHNLGHGWLAIHEDRRQPTEHMSLFKLDQRGRVLDFIHLPKRSVDTLRAIFNSQTN